ncbi:hypothetical protein JCM10207_007079 [Rhodosporidiobolus poonsookiae]
MASLVSTRRLGLVTRHLTPSVASPSSFVSSSASSPRLLSTSTTRQNSLKQPYPYIFTTASTFHGKPPPPSPVGSSSDSPSPRKSRTPPRLAQGLPDSHPLIGWRDAQLADGPPHGAGHDWFFVEGIPRPLSNEGGVQGLKAGEDGVRGVVMGIADGVGGWEESGVDPSHFSQALMYFARERVRLSASSASEQPSSPSQSGWAWPAEEKQRNGERLRELLRGAFEDVKGEKAIVAGSSTACLLALDAETGMLHAANLGDSGFLVFRPQPPAELPPTPPSSPSSPPPPPQPITYKLLHSQPPQVFFFNAPAQLSKFPRGEDTSNALLSSPKDAATHSLQLEDGDVVLLFTDGFSDNVFDEGEADVLVSAVRSKLDALASASAASEEGAPEPSRAERDKDLASSLARTAVAFARMIAVRHDKVTPFEREADKWIGRGKHGMQGGKVDDVTVCVAVVRKEE